MQKLNCISILLVITLNVCGAEDKWIWSKTKSNQKVRSYYPAANKNVYYVGDEYARADRDREPTTKRPIPGQPQNDDIDDYTDANDELTKQNSPYTPTGPVGLPLFGSYPQVTGFQGNAPNGILVGPGGPTGIIGRPPPSSFPIAGNYPGFAVPQNFPASAGFPGNNGLSNVFGQYPYANPNNPQQFGGAQYPQNQYPGAQYPQPPQYTEGYGLANINPGFNINPNFNGNFNPSFGFAFDEYPGQVEGKSASIKTIDKKVDDKVTKNLKKS